MGGFGDKASSAGHSAWDSMLPELEGAVGEEAWRLREFCRSVSPQIEAMLRAAIRRWPAAGSHPRDVACTHRRTLCSPHPGGKCCSLNSSSGKVRLNNALIGIDLSDAIQP
jgi:hypothetical protein